jgi:hypothetical protein
MRLAELQRELQRDLLGSPSAIGGAIVDAPPLPVEARLGIYRHAYRSRLAEALDDVYPVLHKILGDETFASMAELFIEAHPSIHRSIRWYGSEVPEFLAAQAPFAEQPVLAEIARFEWISSEVFDAPDAAPLDRRALGERDPESWPALKFHFHPSIRRLALSWNTVPIWQSMNKDEQPPMPDASAAPVPWVIWRHGFKNYFRSLDGAEMTALDVAIAERSFAEICEALAAHLDQDEIPLRAATLLGGWLDGGMIVGID